MIRPDAVLKDLARLWVSLGEEKQGVLRACTMTLLVLAEDAENPQAIAETVAALMREHPSRAILARFHSTAAGEFSARVYAQCWMPFGQRRQICCEQIEIAAPEAGMADVAGVARALAAPDLPAVVWCRSPRLFRHPAFADLAGVAAKVVVDGALLGAPAEALAALAAPTHPNIADLAWTRLTRRREIVAQIFENRDYLARAASARAVSVGYGGSRPPLEALYFGAWMQYALAQAGARVEIAFESLDGAAPGLGRIVLQCPGLALSLGLGEGASEIRLDDLVTRSVCPGAAEHLLLGEELRFLRRDPVYEAVLALARGYV